MSLIRPKFVDGQALTTPELQRVADTAAYADDRVYEVIFTPGSTSKKITPLVEETNAVNPQLLVVPSGTNGKVACKPCHLVAGATQTITYTANLTTQLDAPAIASNSSGSTRYDLVYVALNRTVPNTIALPPANTAYAGTGLSDSSTATTTRKVKSVVDGTISTQSVNLYDSPTITTVINQGFKTGATPPTSSEIQSGLPADTGGAFSFALAYITVANGYTAGTAISQTAITQVWERSGVVRGRTRVSNVVTPAFASTSFPYSSRLGFGGRIATVIKYAAGDVGTDGVIETGTTANTKIDWRNRFIRVRMWRAATGANSPELETSPAGDYGEKGGFTGNSGSPTITAVDMTVNGKQFLFKTINDGRLAVAPQTSPTNSSDYWYIEIEYSDRFIAGV